MRPLHRIALIGALCVVLGVAAALAWSAGRDAASDRPPHEVVVGESPAEPPPTPAASPSTDGPADPGVVAPPPAVAESPGGSPTPGEGTAPQEPAPAPGGDDDDLDDDSDDGDDDDDD